MPHKWSSAPCLRNPTTNFGKRTEAKSSKRRGKRYFALLVLTASGLPSGEAEQERYCILRGCCFSLLTPSGGDRSVRLECHSALRFTTRRYFKELGFALYPRPFPHCLHILFETVNPSHVPIFPCWCRPSLITPAATATAWKGVNMAGLPATRGRA